MRFNQHIDMYTDGSTRANGTNKARGGWAYLLMINTNEIYTNYGGEANTTNNRMELTAIIKGIENAKERYPDKIIDMYIYSDSAYIINCYEQKWYKKWLSNGWLNSNKQPVANQDLWEQLIPYFEDDNYEFFKVKGHSINEFNNMVDKLACKGADEVIKE